MCEIKVLVVGNSDQRNLEAIKAISRRCREESHGTAKLICDGRNAETLLDPNIDDYDLVAIDDNIVPTIKGHMLMGFDVPAVVFSDLIWKSEAGQNRKTKNTISSVIAHAVARGNLREKLASITEQIEQTSRHLATI